MNFSKISACLRATFGRNSGSPTTQEPFGDSSGWTLRTALEHVQETKYTDEQVSRTQPHKLVSEKTSICERMALAMTSCSRLVQCSRASLSAGWATRADTRRHSVQKHEVGLVCRGCWELGDSCGVQCLRNRSQSALVADMHAH